MSKQRYKKLSFEFPSEEYVYLKMMCAEKGVSLKDFVVQAVIRSIGEYEDELDMLALEKITEDERRNAIPWEVIKRELEFDRAAVKNLITAALLQNMGPSCVLWPFVV